MSHREIRARSVSRVEDSPKIQKSYRSKVQWRTAETVEARVRLDAVTMLSSPVSGRRGTNEVCSRKLYYGTTGCTLKCWGVLNTQHGGSARLPRSVEGQPQGVMWYAWDWYWSYLNSWHLPFTWVMTVNALFQVEWNIASQLPFLWGWAAAKQLPKLLHSSLFEWTFNASSFCTECNGCFQSTFWSSHSRKKLGSQQACDGTQGYRLKFRVVWIAIIVGIEWLLLLDWL